MSKKKLLSRSMRSTLSHMLYVYELEMKKRPSWMSDTLYSMELEKVEDARRLVASLLDFKV